MTWAKWRILRYSSTPAHEQVSVSLSFHHFSISGINPLIPVWRVRICGGCGIWVSTSFTGATSAGWQISTSHINVKRWNISDFNAAHKNLKPLIFFKRGSSSTGGGSGVNTSNLSPVLLIGQNSLAPAASDWPSLFAWTPPLTLIPLLTMTLKQVLPGLLSQKKKIQNCKMVSVNFQICLLIWNYVVRIMVDSDPPLKILYILQMIRKLLNSTMPIVPQSHNIVRFNNNVCTQIYMYEKTTTNKTAKSIQVIEACVPAPALLAPRRRRRSYW